jgi:hypothetical protein
MDAGFSGLGADYLLMPRRQRVACFKLRYGALPNAKQLGEFGLRHLENVLSDDSDSAHGELIISFPNIVKRQFFICFSDNLARYSISQQETG